MTLIDEQQEIKAKPRFKGIVLPNGFIPVYYEDSLEQFNEGIHNNTVKSYRYFATTIGVPQNDGKAILLLNKIN